MERTSFAFMLCGQHGAERGHLSPSRGAAPGLLGRNHAIDARNVQLHALAVEDSLGRTVRAGYKCCGIRFRPDFRPEWIPSLTLRLIQSHGPGCHRARRQGGKKVHPVVIKPATSLGGRPQQGIDEEAGDCPQVLRTTHGRGLTPGRRHRPGPPRLVRSLLPLCRRG